MKVLASGPCQAALLAVVVDEVTDSDPLLEIPAADLTQVSVGSKMLPKSNPLVPMGPGLPALPKKLVDRVQANEYIDFLELPPAKGKVRTLNQSLEGK